MIQLISFAQNTIERPAQRSVSSVAISVNYALQAGVKRSSGPPKGSLDAFQAAKRDLGLTALDSFFVKHCSNAFGLKLESNNWKVFVCSSEQFQILAGVCKRSPEVEGFAGFGAFVSRHSYGQSLLYTSILSFWLLKTVVL